MKSSEICIKAAELINNGTTSFMCNAVEHVVMCNSKEPLLEIRKPEVVNVLSFIKRYITDDSGYTYGTFNSYLYSLGQRYPGMEFLKIARIKFLEMAAETFRLNGE